MRQSSHVVGPLARQQSLPNASSQARALVEPERDAALVGMHQSDGVTLVSTRTSFCSSRSSVIGPREM
jgi:hypothetical protein